MGDDAIEQLTEYLDSVDISMDQLERYSGIDWYNYLMDKQSISTEEWNQIHAAAGEAKDGPIDGEDNDPYGEDSDVYYDGYPRPWPWDRLKKDPFF